MTFAEALRAIRGKLREAEGVPLVPAQRVVPAVVVVVSGGASSTGSDEWDAEEEEDRPKALVLAEARNSGRAIVPARAARTAYEHWHVQGLVRVRTHLAIELENVTRLSDYACRGLLLSILLGRCCGRGAGVAARRGSRQRYSLAVYRERETMQRYGRGGVYVRIQDASLKALRGGGSREDRLVVDDRDELFVCQ